MLTTWVSTGGRIMTMMAIPRHSLLLPGSSKWTHFVGGISERRPKRLLFLLCSFVVVGVISTREREREGRRKVLLNEEARVVASGVARRRSSIIVLCYIPGTRWRMEGGGSIGKDWINGGTGRSVLIF